MELEWTEARRSWNLIYDQDDISDQWENKMGIIS